MKLISLLLVFFFFQPPLINEWVGDYYGIVDGKQAVLTIEAQKDKLVGEVNAEGYYYQFTATAKEDIVTGYINNIQTGESLVMSARKNDENEIIVSVEEVYYIFSSEEPEKPKKTVVTKENLDPELIGSWRYTEVNNTNDFSVATDYFLLLNQDGTFTYKIGDSDGESDAGNFSSGSNESHSGNWKNIHNAIYLKEDDKWEVFAKYSLDGNLLLLEFEDGQKQTWNRQ